MPFSVAEIPVIFVAESVEGVIAETLARPASTRAAMTIGRIVEEVFIKDII